MNEKKPYGIDVAVLLIFFSRPGCFARVFEQVREARPSRLFLYQDGPRRGSRRDIEGIRKCREIAAGIDWACEVHTKFQHENIGCDPSEYIAQKWAFEHVDKCIILEDDDVPARSFFPFCRELLDYYENDQRINMICGMNHLGTVDSPYSYLFSTTGSIWGWATWKRVVDGWDSRSDILTRAYDRERLLGFAGRMWGRGAVKKRLEIWERDRASGVAHYETILGLGQLASGRLNIIPARNMILNIGNTPEGGTHSARGIETIPRGLRRIFTMGLYEMEFPLRHPEYVIDDVDYQKRLFRIMGWGYPFVALGRRIEKAFLLLRHEGFSGLTKKVWTARHSH